MDLGGLSIDTEHAIEAPLPAAASEPYSAVARGAEDSRLQGPIDDSVALALRLPAAYPEGPLTIEVIETHRAWVF